MKIVKITVGGGRTFNHPNEAYSNFRPSIEMTGTLEEGDVASDWIRSMQHEVEQLLDAHRAEILARCEEERAHREEELEDEGVAMSDWGK